MELKLKMVPVDLCKYLPDEFIDYFNYARSLDFEEKPNYHYIRGLFKRVFKRFQFKFDYIFDWCIKKDEGEEEDDKKINQSKDILDIRFKYLSEK